MYKSILLILTLGIHGALTAKGYFKKMLFLNLFQVGIIIFYLYVGRPGYINAMAPSISNDVETQNYAQWPHYLHTHDNTSDSTGINPHNPVEASAIPTVLMLTAIVVGFTSFAVGLTLISAMR